MNTKVFFLLAGVAVALAAPGRPRTTYGLPRDSSSFEHSAQDSFSFEHSAQDSFSFEHSAQDSSSFEHSAQDSSSFEHFSPSSSSASFESYESGESTEAKYAFQWSVEDESTGNDFDHKEARDGDYTQGVYTVLLPDGRLQTVTYHVDGDDGYVADVKYKGEARYPHYSSESYESRESFESSSGSAESRESRVYAPPPRRTYFAPDSNESK